MFFTCDILGDALPPKTLCLTFDDGPGPETLALAEYLNGQEIAATFFVIGAHAHRDPAAISQLRAFGHLVGNHTNSHPPLVAFHRNGGDVLAEIAATQDAIGIARAEEATATFFRPPYGDWRDEPVKDCWGESPVISNVAQTLNNSGRFPGIVGPVGWDIDARDWEFWRDHQSAEAAGQAYLAAIVARDRGVVLLHDSAETEALRAGNRCLDLVRWLVPILQERGYQFVRLDAVPGVRSAAATHRLITLGTPIGQWLTCSPDSALITLTPPGARAGGREAFGIVPLNLNGQEGLVTLRAWNGYYLTQTAGGLVLAEAAEIDDNSLGRIVALGSDQCKIEFSNREFLTCGHSDARIYSSSNGHPFRMMTA